MFTERHGKFTERHVYRQGAELKSARALLKRVAERCPGPVEGERSTRLVLFGRAPLATACLQAGCRAVVSCFESVSRILAD